MGYPKVRAADIGTTGKRRVGYERRKQVLAQTAQWEKKQRSPEMMTQQDRRAWVAQGVCVCGRGNG